MVVTGTDTVAEIDEALTHLQAGHLVARACGDVRLATSLAEEIDQLLAARHQAATHGLSEATDEPWCPEKSSNLEDVETRSLALSPRHRHEILGR